MMCQYGTKMYHIPLFNLCVYLFKYDRREGGS